MKQFNVVDAWLNNVAYSHSKSSETASHYRRYLKRFCEFVGCTPQQIVEEYENSDDRRFRRKYAQYLRAFNSNLMENGYAPGSLRFIAGVIKSFFKYNDLPLAYVPFAPFKITYHNRDISKHEVVSILNVSRLREKAFYCMMAQSGLRPITLGLLRRKHIEPDFSEGITPCQIVVPSELTKGQFGSYFTFMDVESVKYLSRYFEKRKNRVEPGDYLFTSEGSNRQLNEKSATRIFKTTIEKLKGKGLIDFEQKQAGKPRNLRLYTLRKYFRRQARKEGGIDYVNFMMGHKTNYQSPHIPSSDTHYFSREDVKYLRDLYREKMAPYLRLESETPIEMSTTIKMLEKQLEANKKDHSEEMKKVFAAMDVLAKEIQLLREEREG